jgi:hypothetical protein
VAKSIFFSKMLLCSVGTRRYSTLLDATRRYSTLLDATRRYSTLLDATRRYSTLLEASRRAPRYSNVTPTEKWTFPKPILKSLKAFGESARNIFVFLFRWLTQALFNLFSKVDGQVNILRIRMG